MEPERPAALMSARPGRRIERMRDDGDNGELFLAFLRFDIAAEELGLLIS
ncbi:MAG TPA: hypothetical protein VK673_09070 [Chthoniobacterales bacterium]|nr:hypothetical protein [Chthoniobacterales bacterium]